MKHVVVDPITRSEGHLRVEVQVDEGSGKVTDAISSGTAWRGLELVMKDRDPRDAWAYIQRICGVCTSAHALGSLRAVEDALGIKIPKNANYIRNIMAATLTVQDHIVHFYHLHALDWVSPVEALAADPVATANLQVAALNAYKLPFSAPGTSVTEAYDHAFPAATPQYFAEIKGKVQAIVESGQLGIFSANWWDHPDYKLLPPEVHLMAIAHYLEMLDKHRDLVTPQELQSVFGAAAKVNTAAATPEKCCADAQGASVCVWLSRGIAGTSTRDKSQLHVVEMVGKYPGQPILPVGVAGLGDTAGWVENVGELFVFKGNVLLRVTVNPPDRATFEQVKTLAEKAAPRLPN